MYASGKSEGLLTCEWCKVKHWSVKSRAVCGWCKVKHWSVKSRVVMCGDHDCRCEYDAIVCKPCAEKTYE